MQRRPTSGRCWLTTAGTASGTCSSATSTSACDSPSAGMAPYATGVVRWPSPGGCAIRSRRSRCWTLCSSCGRRRQPTGSKSSVTTPRSRIRTQSRSRFRRRWRGPSRGPDVTSRRSGQEASQHRAGDHRPAALPAPLAAGSRMARGAHAQRGRAGPNGPHIHQRLLQHRDVLPKPRDPVHRALSSGARCRADPHGRRPASRSAQCASCRGEHGRHPAPRRGPSSACSDGVCSRRPASRTPLGQRVGAPGWDGQPRKSPAGGGDEVAYKGKWHLTHPSGDGSLLSGWSQQDETRIARDYGFADWEAPDAGENARAEHFGGGNAGEGTGWDDVYTSQAERWLGRSELPEPFCLVVSLVNPHDVLGYPASYERGGYSVDAFRDLGVELPPTVDEEIKNKPAVHALMQMGMDAYLGPLRGRQAKLDYVNFYAYLHRVVDRKLGRLLAALGDADDPGSLRSRTVVVRCADHGEMGLSHGGLRQKTFNVYEETINIPLVVSNPVLFPRGAETDALASLVDVLPTMLRLGGIEAPDVLRGRDLT